MNGRAPYLEPDLASPESLKIFLKIGLFQTLCHISTE